MKSKYELRIAHLYGDLMNTYGDYGNILVLQYYGRKMGIKVDANVVSIGSELDPDKYDLAIFGDGQYFEQSIVAKDLPFKKNALTKMINRGVPMLAVGEGYQLLGKSYLTPKGHKMPGLGIMSHTTDQRHRDHDFVGEERIADPITHQTYHGFEHHQDQTFLGNGEKPLGKVIDGMGGNNTKVNGEGAQLKNLYCTYIHSFLARNPEVTKSMLLKALKNKYPDEDFSKLAAMKFAPSY
ncbi:type 1 glutamine amidotransferase [Acetilactobacillus jinshanensis]|uniref:Lipid II isoglutaminyl synthase (glutamine-hydrolyzing) subunit GatD n=1 Tax=Acetilactobacillus jinshanensis TaxID=1720083 RepID=A0A4V1ALI2_9LACO|nr:glutamine amidotransferase [Acetilactobacillus jinshanensis]QBP17689.1 glutamine amidotransferase [Acetilactobacillus jinshanensis]URL61767.1 glutamine amidotransferase [uncultured bacterium]